MAFLFVIATILIIVAIIFCVYFFGKGWNVLGWLSVVFIVLVIVLTAYFFDQIESNAYQ